MSKTALLLMSALLLAGALTPATSATVLSLPRIATGPDYDYQCDQSIRDFSGVQESGCWPRTIYTYSNGAPAGTTFSADFYFASMTSLGLEDDDPENVIVCIEGTYRVCSDAGQARPDAWVRWRMSADQLPPIGDWNDNGHAIKAWLVTVRLSDHAGNMVASWMQPSP